MYTEKDKERINQSADCADALSTALQDMISANDLLLGEMAVGLLNDARVLNNKLERIRYLVMRGGGITCASMSVTGTVCLTRCVPKIGRWTTGCGSQQRTGRLFILRPSLSLDGPKARRCPCPDRPSVSSPHPLKRGNHEQDCAGSRWI